MKNFTIKCFIFTIPVIVLFIFPFIIFVRSGEGLPISAVVAMQQQDQSDALYMSGLTSANDKYYKLLTTIQKDPSIIVFGTSRTLTFDSDFFTNPTEFYNAGYNANASLRTSDLLVFVNAIPAQSNLHVILLDMSNFLDSQNEPSSYVTNNFFDAIHLFLSTGWHDIYTDYFKGTISLTKFNGSSQSDIGLLAIMNGFGYQADGSLDRGDENKDAVQKIVSIQITNELSAINSGYITEFGNTISEENLAVIKKFLAICRSRNIYVIGYLSPYAKEIYDAMISLHNPYGDAYRNAPTILSPIFNAYGYHFYDIRDITSIGSSDSELYDAYHPTEKSTIKLLMYLADREPSLKSYVDISKLEKQIETETF